MQKVLFAAVVVGIFLFAGSGVVTATSIVDTWGPVDILMNADNAYYDYTHNILDDGYNPLNHALLSADLDIFLKDEEDDSPSESFKIGLDAGASGGAIQITGGTSGFVYEAVVDSYLSSDGLLTVYIHKQAGDFIFEMSELAAEWELITVSDIPPTGDPIPEPATMFLLGTGLVGVAGAARRRKKNQA